MGGTGGVTVRALTTMAAHLEGKDATALDTVAAAYAPHTEPLCSAILTAPMGICGYGPVRLAAAIKARAEAARQRLS